MQAKLRRHQSALAIDGLAVIFLAAWNLIKPLFYFVYDPESIVEMLGMPVGFYMDAGDALRFALIVFAIEFLLLLYVGVSAIGESRARRHGWLYIVIASCMIVEFVYNKPQMLIDVATGIVSVQALRATLLIDFAATFALVDIVWSAIQVKRLRARLQADASGSDHAS